MFFFLFFFSRSLHLLPFSSRVCHKRHGHCVRMAVVTSALESENGEHRTPEGGQNSRRHGVHHRLSCVRGRTNTERGRGERVQLRVPHLLLLRSSASRPLPLGFFFQSFLIKFVSRPDLRISLLLTLFFFFYTTTTTK